MAMMGRRWRRAAVAFGGGQGRAGNPGGGLPFAGVPSEMQAGVDLLLAEEPELGDPEIEFTQQPSAAARASG